MVQGVVSAPINSPNRGLEFAPFLPVNAAANGNDWKSILIFLTTDDDTLNASRNQFRQVQGNTSALLYTKVNTQQGKH